MTTTVDTHQELAKAKLELAEMQSKVREIEDRIATYEREARIADLDQACNELREQTAFYEATAREHHEVKEKWENKRSHYQAALERVGESDRLRPPIAEYLPGNVDVQRWQKNHDGLIAAAEKIKAEWDAMTSPETITAKVRGYEGPAGLLASLHYRVQNLTRMLEGKSGKSWIEGGVGVSGVR